MAATHNNLRAATAALSAMATILLAVILLALRPIPAFAEENQAQEAAAGNISLSVPTELNCFVKADGQVITPEAKDYAIANTGTEEVMLDAVTVTANSDSGPISLSAEAFVGTTGQPAGTLSSWFSYSKDANGLGDVKSQEKQIIQPGQSLLAKWNVGKLNDKDNANVLNRLSGKDGFALATVTFTFKPKQAFAVLYDDGSAVLYKRCVKQMPVAGNGFNDGTGMRKVSKVVSSIENNEDIFKDDTLINRVTVRDSGIKPRTTKQWFLNCANLTNAELKQLDTSLTSSMESMFTGCTELVSIDVSGWDTRKVTNMSRVFTYCEKITELDLSSWDTSNVTDMYSLFYDCSKLQTISFPEDGAGNKWDTRKVTNMVQLFGNCYDLNPVDVSSWDTASVTNMAYMFAECKKFDKLDLSRWDTGRVTDMAGMFKECSNLESISFPKGNDLKKWDMRNVTSMEDMFEGCTELVSIDVSGWDTRKVTNMSRVFTYCEKITELDLSSWDTSNVTDMYSLFYDCSKLQTISFPEDGAGNKWDTRKVTNMVQLFGNCYDLNPVDVSSWDTASVTNMAYMFAECKKFDKLDLSRWDTGSVTDMEGMFTNCSGLKEITLRQGWKFKFTQCDLPEVLYVKNGDTYSVYNNDDFPITATTTFYTQKGLRAFAVVYDNGTNGKIATLYKRYVDKMPEPGKLFDDGTGARQVSAVIHDIESDHKAGIFSDSDITAVSAADDDIQPSTMERWFSGCTNLKNVNLSRVDASKVVSMANMFAGCGSLAFLDLSGWDATNVKDMSGMFSACFQLDTIKLDGMKVQNVSNLNRMFANCEKLNTLNIPSDWCISKATDKGYTDMGYMFYACKSLKKIDFSKWNISNITNTEYMFYMCSNLSEIAIPSGENPWRVKGSRDDQSNDNGAKFMFGGCSSLLVLDLKNMNVEQVENMSCMFSGCSELTLLDLSGWNASNVKDMSGMFSGCIKLATLKLDSTKVQNASNMDRMFANCENLEMLSIPSDWNTSNVTNMSHMFYACKSIKGLDLSNWNVSSVTDMEQMFATCSNLQMLNLANWRTSGNPVANNLLTSCSSLRQITLGAGWSIDFAIAGFPKPLYVIRGNQYVALTGMPSLTQETTIYTESYKNEHPLEMRATSHDSTLSVEDSAPEPNVNLESSSPRGQFDATTTASSIADAAIDQSANAAEECCDKHVDHELDNLDSNQSAKRSSFSLSKRQEKISIAA